MYKLCFYVPLEAVETVKQAMFEAGGGRIGNYECCAWQTQGTGQFRPLKASNPYLGQHGELASVKEFKVEMVCKSSCIEAVINALKTSHPYEEPAYDVWMLENL